MASVISINGKWRCQIRVKGVALCKTFLTREEAAAWAAETEPKVANDAGSDAQRRRAVRDSLPGTTAQKERERRRWHGMLARCYNQNHSAYANYGGRGVVVCERWRESFESFYLDMWPPKSGCTIDRIDVNGNYEPGNCRWADLATQAKNRRKPDASVKSKRVIERIMRGSVGGELLKLMGRSR